MISVFVYFREEDVVPPFECVYRRHRNLYDVKLLL